MKVVSEELKQIYLDDAPKITTYVINKNSTALQYYDGYEDMRQSLLLELWKALPYYDENRGKFTTFAIRCCQNEIRKQIRMSKAKKRDGLTISVEESITDTLKIADILKDDTDLVEELISSSMCKQIIPMLNQEAYLYYIERKTQKEIAAIEQKTQSYICRKIKNNILRIRQFYEQNTKAM